MASRSRCSRPMPGRKRSGPRSSANIRVQTPRSPTPGTIVRTTIHNRGFLLRRGRREILQRCGRRRTADDAGNAGLDLPHYAGRHTAEREHGLTRLSPPVVVTQTFWAFGFQFVDRREGVLTQLREFEGFGRFDDLVERVSQFWIDV